MRQPGVQRRRKNFLFLGERTDRCTLRLKTADGWQRIEFAPGDAPPLGDLEALVTESFLLLAPKPVRARFDER